MGEGKLELIITENPEGGKNYKYNLRLDRDQLTEILNENNPDKVNSKLELDTKHLNALLEASKKPSVDSLKN